MAGRRLRLIVAWCLATTIARRAPAAEEPPEDAAMDRKEQGSSASFDGADEVRVQGHRSEPSSSQTSLRAREIREIPGAFGDAFRALEALPGITPIMSGLPYFFVRGAPPGNTGYFVDGVRVPGLFHLGVGPAVMYPALLEHVDLYKGAPPVSFGRFAGGILSAETTRPSESAKLDTTLRLFDAGALVEVPFGGRKDDDATPPTGSALVSGRYGYPGLLLSVFAPNVGLSYWDYQSRVTYNISNRDILSVFSFGSYDSVRQRDITDSVPRGELSEVLNIQFHRIDLRWDHRTSATGSVRTALTVGYDRTASDGFAARSWMLGTRVSAREELSKSVTVRTGADMVAQTFDFRLGRAGGGLGSPMPEGATTGQSGVQSDVVLGAWVDTPLRLGGTALVTPGLRADVFTSRGLGTARAILGLDPRVTTRLPIGPIYHLSALGIAHQAAAFPVPVPALTFSQLRRGLQTSYQLSQGLEVPLFADITAEVTGFLHTYTGLVDLAKQCDVSDPKCDPSGTRGRSVGIEAMVKRKFGARVSGWASYTLSRSTRDAYDPELRRETTRLTDFDRTHVLNLILSLDLGRGWRAGGRYAGYTGIPYSTIDELLPPNARTPAFHRIDLRLEKRWTSPGRSYAFTAEMFNVLFMKESIGISCTGASRGIPPSCKPDEIGPIAIPSLGFEASL